MHRRSVAVAVLVVALAGGYAGMAGAQGGAAKQTIGMKEFRFALPAKLKAGRTTVTFNNTGTFPHNFTVVSALGGKAFKSATVAGGAKEIRVLTLRPGAYVAVCTVFNGFHLSEGMEKRFTVGRFDQAAGAWKAE